MTEDEYRQFVAKARMDANLHLARLLLALRRELWPDPLRDPISREDSMRRLRRELAVDAYWGAAISPPGRLMYGGICAS